MRQLAIRTLSQEVMALPEGERLEYALYLIDELTGRVDETAQFLRDTYGLTPAEARVAAALNAASPHMVGHASLMAALSSENANIELVRQRVNAVRKKLPVPVTVHWGEGYSMPIKIDIPHTALRPHTRENYAQLWTDEDDADLRRLVNSGSDVSAIADELGRTERAVIDRMRALGIKLAGR